ncbi:hypothetical protein BJ508DRAFT_414222 [Ascobolus immersus RN42]|uniref:NACHT domain-containing protein n=1 Tax=Ascobolus immersus RN42 TaxID=1160509 RepID=A0A3N4I8J6_ASCIM|nr:hypothetical protein BJ508DRAFT_414222 [Ascobolus immersus RN42]
MEKLKKWKSKISDNGKGGKKRSSKPIVAQPSNSSTAGPSVLGSVKAQAKHYESEDAVDVAPVPESTAQDPKSQQWKIALEIVRNQLSDEEQLLLPLDESTPDVTSLSTVFDTARRVKESPDLQNRNGLDQFLIGFQKYAGIVDRVVQHQPEFTSLVWASLSFLLEVYVNHLKNLDELQEALDSILTSLTFGEFYMDKYATAMADKVSDENSPSRSREWKEKTDQALAELYAAIVILCIKARMYFQAGRKRTRIGNAIKPFETTLLPIIRKVHEKELFLRRLAEMGTQQRIVGMDMKLDKLDAILNEMNDKLTGITDKEVFEWLNAIDPESFYEEKKNEQLDGTCGWLRAAPAYKAWIKGETNVWLEGIPGAGKSVIAASIVHDLRMQEETDEGAIPLFYFFRDSIKTTKTPVAAVSSLISQLLRNAGPDARKFMEILKEIIRKSSYFKGGEVADSSLRTRYRALLRMLMLSRRRVLILLDALDECSSASEFAKCWFGNSQNKDFKISSKECSHVRMLLTGRPVVSEHFAELSGFKEIKMSVCDDIKRFVKVEVGKNPRLKGTEDQIIKKVYKSSDGMFRYAALLLKDLQRYSKRSIESRISEAPTGIFGMYEAILERLAENEKGSEEHLELRRRILLTILASEGPPSVQDLQGICSTSLDTEDVGRANAEPPTLKDIVDAGGELISLYQTVSLFEDVETGFLLVIPQTNVQFSHRTVQEFLGLPLHYHSENAKSRPSISKCLFGVMEPYFFLLNVAVIQFQSKPFLDLSGFIHALANRYWDKEAWELSLNPLLRLIFDSGYGYSVLNFITNFRIIAPTFDHAEQYGSRDLPQRTLQSILAQFLWSGEARGALVNILILWNMMAWVFENYAYRNEPSSASQQISKRPPRKTTRRQMETRLRSSWQKPQVHLAPADVYQSSALTGFSGSVGTIARFVFEFVSFEVVDGVDDAVYRRGRAPNGKIDYAATDSQADFFGIFLATVFGSVSFQKELFANSPKALDLNREFTLTYDPGSDPVPRIRDEWDFINASLLDQAPNHKYQSQFILVIFNRHLDLAAMPGFRKDLSFVARIPRVWRECGLNFDINRQGFLRLGDPDPADISMSLLHLLSYAEAQHIMNHQENRSMWKEGCCDLTKYAVRSTEQTREIPVLLLEQCAEWLDLSGVNSKGYSPLGMLREARWKALEMLSDKDIQNPEWFNSLDWYCVYFPQPYERALVERGAKAIYPAGHPLIEDQECGVCEAEKSTWSGWMSHNLGWGSSIL